MAKTGDSPDRKDKPKPRPRAARPSFAQPAAPAASSAWVYRSDAPAAKPAVAAAKAAAPIAKAVVVAPAAKPVVAAPAPSRRRVQAPVVAAPVAAAPVPAARSSRVVHALDVVTLPIAVSLMAVLAPMRRLLGPSRS